MSRALLLFLLFTATSLSAQAPLNIDQLYQQYERYKEPTIKDRRFKHSNIAPLIGRMKQVPGVEVRLLGKSVEGRSIQSVRIGKGPVKVLLWSQMHGDEPTATMAIMDLFNFFRQKGDGFDPMRAFLTNTLSIYFIPMLNPDGAEKYQRRNAVGMDLNRDAIRLQSPEARILKNMRDELDADWGFNLHDQSRYYTAGGTGKQATFSFLAPAFNEAKDINDVRERSMQLTVVMNEVVHKYLPGQTAKYDDTFEPRAFGDNIQKWGTSTILIECGGLAGDPEKQEMRKIHFAMLLAAFHSIASQSYQIHSTEEYFEIPDNTRKLMDLLIKSVEIEVEGQPFIVDLAFRSNEIENNKTKNGFYTKGYLNDLGDLSVYAGTQEFNAQGMKLVPGKLYPEVLEDINALERKGMMKLLEQGYTDVRLRKRPPLDQRYELPLMIHSSKYKGGPQLIEVGQNPSFLLMEEGTYKYAVVNGRLFEL